MEMIHGNKDLSSHVAGKNGETTIITQLRSNHLSILRRTGLLGAAETSTRLVLPENRIRLNPFLVTASGIRSVSLVYTNEIREWLVFMN